jgi:ParB family chromosome partitioning protein
MATGRKTDLASLAASVGDNSPVERGASMDSRPAALTTPLDDLVANPRNPRDDVGNLEDLESIADMQLQPAVAVTKAAYLKLYPKDAITAKYVVVNGCRRLAAARKYGRTDLLVHVNDELARDRVTLISASIAENVDRQDFDVIEEAKAVDALVAECGRADEAAKRLKKTPGWVSQRRALLALDPELQTALRRGELAIREARSLAQVPLEQQVVRWRALMNKKDRSGEGSGTGPPRSASRIKVLGTALGQFDAKPELLADALRTYLGDDGVNRLVHLLSAGGSA